MFFRHSGHSGEIHSRLIPGVQDVGEKRDIGKSQQNFWNSGHLGEIAHWKTSVGMQDMLDIRGKLDIVKIDGILDIREKRNM